MNDADGLVILRAFTFARLVCRENLADISNVRYSDRHLIPSHPMTSLREAIVLSLWTLAACSGRPPAMPAGVELQITTLSLTDSATSAALGPLRFRGAVALRSRSESFGSYSGLHVSEDGTDLVAIGSRGWLVGHLRYGPSGDLAGFDLEGEFPIRDARGQPVIDAADRDAESLVEAGGQYYVGFETNSRVSRFDGITAAAQPVNLPPEELATIPRCCGFSSVVITGQQELLALTEAARDSAGNVKGWIWAEEEPEVIWLRAAPGWFPVDLALLPHGDLLLVEVRHGKSNLWHSRFSRIAATNVSAGKIMQARSLGELHSASHPDRIEGIHARTGRNGEILIYAISDSGRGWPTNVLLFELRDP